MADLNIKRVENSALLADRVADNLREAIITGELWPGQHLKENDIAKRLGVSTISLRQAFTYLEQEGLITIVPRRGKFVRVFDNADVEDVFAMRAALESLACKQVIKNGSLAEEDFGKLEACIAAQESAIADGDLPKLADLDMDFHEMICRKSGSKLLLSTWRQIRSQVKALIFRRWSTLGDYGTSTVRQDHNAILEALRDRDAGKLVKITEEYNTRVGQQLMKI